MCRHLAPPARCRRRSRHRAKRRLPPRRPAPRLRRHHRAERPLGLKRVPVLFALPRQVRYLSLRARRCLTPVLCRSSRHRLMGWNSVAQIGRQRLPVPKRQTNPACHRQKTALHGKAKDRTGCGCCSAGSGFCWPVSYSFLPDAAALLLGRSPWFRRYKNQDRANWRSL